MVATFASYATIEEAWGPSPPPPAKEKKKKPRAFDDIFESFAEDVMPSVTQNVCEPPPNLPERGEAVKQPLPLPCQHNIEDLGERQLLNFAMYVFSGVCLIFVMEQFIQIGIAMRGSR